MPKLDPTKPDELPAPTPEAALLSALMEAFVATQPKARALFFLRKTAEILSDRENHDAVVVRLKRSERSQHVAERKVNRQSIALFRRMLEGCVARLGEDGLPPEE